MKNIFLILATPFILISNSLYAQRINKLTAEEKKEGWTLLFDGHSLNGWHKYGGKPAGTAWKVSDGELFLDPSQKKDWQIADGGDIVTDRSFKNFHFN